MLLTKPLTTFLNANRTPHIHTLLLVTPTGKLLSGSSQVPASTLRAQATHACSLWALYKPLTAAGTISVALPSHAEQDEDNPEFSHRAADPEVSSITIQLEKGIMVIRALKCSLLFVVIGPSSSSTVFSTSLPGLRQDLSYLSVASASSPPTSSHSTANGDSSVERRQGSSFTNLNGLRSSSASIAGSILGTGAGSMKVLRKQAEELGKWLDGELEGLCLSSGL